MLQPAKLTLSERITTRLGETSGQRLWVLTLLAAAALRLLVIPLNHYWDTFIWYNFFADLVHNHSPYDSFQELSYLVRSSKINLYYEGFAYPPGLIYLYYPVAFIYKFFDPQITSHYASPGTIPDFSAPLPFMVFFKIPVLAADLLTGWFLRKLGGYRAALLYLFNPYVILMFSWMFDSTMVLCIVAGLYFLERGKLNRSAAFLAVGTLIKFVPVFIVPGLLIYLWKNHRNLKKSGQFLLVYLLVLGVGILPFLDGLLFVLGFQAQRVGGGLNWQTVWYFLNNWFPTTRWDTFVFSFSGAVGTLFLFGGLLVTYALVYHYNLSILATFLVCVAGYLTFTKIVNEVYVLPLVALLLVQLARHVSPALTRCYKLLWSVPLAWTAINTPLFLFGATFLGGLGLVDAQNLAYQNSFQPRQEISLVLFLTGTFFTVLCFTTMLLAIRAGKNNEQENFAAGEHFAMRFIRKNLDRYIVIIVLGLGLVGLGYSWFQSQYKLSQAEVANYEGTIAVNLSDNAILFQRDNFSGRPSITTPGGFSLLDYNDRYSKLTINGTDYNLWDAGHGYSVDSDKHTLYHTIRGDNWTVFQEVSLGPDNHQINVRYYYTNASGASQVSLSLPHYHYYYQNLTVTSQGFAALVPNVTRQSVERNEPTAGAAKYSLTVTEGATSSDSSWIDYKSYSDTNTQFGVANVFTVFSSRPILANEKALIASEVIKWSNQNP